MNSKPESSKYFILKKNTPIKLSELLGEKDIAINSKIPKKYLITVRPHANSLNKSGYRSNSLVLSGRPNARKFVFKLSDLLQRKSMLESSFILRNRVLEKIDEQSESSTTSAESRGCDLKLSKPLTDINRLRGGSGSQKCCREKRGSTRNKCNQTDPEDSNTDFCKRTWRVKCKRPRCCRARCKSRCRRFRCISPSVTSLQIYEADMITAPTKDAICQTKDGERERLHYHSTDMLGIPALDSETCNKVSTLEQQLHEMTDELKDLREELLTPNDLQKFKFLSEQFREVSELLAELRSNCVKYLKGTTPRFLEIQEPCDDCKVHKRGKHGCNCNHHRDSTSHLNALPTPRYNGSDYDNSEFNLSHASSSPKKCKPLYFAKMPNETDEDHGSPKEHYSNTRENYTSTRDHYSSPREQYGSPRDHYSPRSGKSISPSSSTVSKSCVYVKLPVINSKLDQIIHRMIGNCKHENITLTVVLESTQLFHINVSVLRTGKSLGCIYATEPAINEAQRKHFFDDFLTFFVLNSKNTIEERNKMLNHSFDGKH